jgi:hypothetical protein
MPHLNLRMVKTRQGLPVQAALLKYLNKLCGEPPE